MFAGEEGGRGREAERYAIHCPLNRLARFNDVDGMGNRCNSGTFVIKRSDLSLNLFHNLERFGRNRFRSFSVGARNFSRLDLLSRFFVFFRIEDDSNYEATIIYFMLRRVRIF